MKSSKKVLLLSIGLIFFLQGRAAENLPERTRNLNILPMHKYAQLKFSAAENDSKNFLRDLACNCDNADFEFILELKINPFAMMNSDDFEQFTQIVDPMVRNIIMQVYAKRVQTEIEKNLDNFGDHNLKEMLFAVDQDGKTAFDILEEKQAAGKPGCVMLKGLFAETKRFIEYREEVQKQNKLEAELERNQ